MAALLAAVAIYQGAVVIPELRKPPSLAAFLLKGASRAEDQNLSVPTGTKLLVLQAYVPVQDFHYRSYLCKVFREDEMVFSVQSAQPKEGDPVTIPVPTDKLKPGKQELRIYGQVGEGAEGAEGNPIQTYPFSFQTN